MYNFNLSAQELRHGKYHVVFRNTVISSSKRWAFLWDRYNVMGKRARGRMANDELMAQLFGVVLEGVTDGGQPKEVALRSIPSDNHYIGQHEGGKCQNGTAAIC